MRNSRPTGPASGGTAAVGIALLFGSGAFGFFMLNTIARTGPAPLPAPNWVVAGSGEDDTQPAVPAAPQIALEEEDLFDLFDRLELPDLFSPPNMIMGALPKN